jgi:Icc-related predicted phosphoesterase
MVALGDGQTVRIFAFTDFHGNEEALLRARLKIAEEKPAGVIVAGDIANHDSEKAKRYLAYLAEAQSQVYFVPGNMDGIDLVAWPGGQGVHGLHGKCEYLENMGLIGLGGSPHGAFTTPIEYSEKEATRVLQRALSNYHGGDLILVSHCPPKDTKIDQVVKGQHIGSTSVRDFVERTQPILVVSGHVHEAQGDDRIRTTVVVNTGPAKSGNYAKITIDRTVTVDFGKLK